MQIGFWKWAFSFSKAVHVTWSVVCSLLVVCLSCVWFKVVCLLRCMLPFWALGCFLSASASCLPVAVLSVLLCLLMCLLCLLAFCGGSPMFFACAFKHNWNFRLCVGSRWAFVLMLFRAVGPASVELQLGVAFLIAFASALAFADVALVQAWVRPQLGAQFAHAACSSSSLLHLAFAIAVFYSFAFLFGCLFSWVGFGTEAHGLRRAHCCCGAWPNACLRGRLFACQVYCSLRCCRGCVRQLRICVFDFRC